MSEINVKRLKRLAVFVICIVNSLLLGMSMAGCKPELQEWSLLGGFLLVIESCLLIVFKEEARGMADWLD